MTASEDILRTVGSTYQTPPAGRRSTVAMAGFARPANTTVYEIGDVMTDSTGTANAHKIPDAGRSGTITKAVVLTNTNVAYTFRLFIFNGEPTNFLDGASLALVDADLAKLVAVYDFTANASAIGVGNTNYYYQLSSAATESLIPTQYATADGNLWALLTTVASVTPSASEEFILQLHIEADV